MLRCVAASILTFCPNGLLAPATAFNPEGLTFFMIKYLGFETEQDKKFEIQKLQDDRSDGLLICFMIKDIADQYFFLSKDELKDVAKFINDILKETD